MTDTNDTDSDAEQTVDRSTAVVRRKVKTLDSVLDILEQCESLGEARDEIARNRNKLASQAHDESEDGSVIIFRKHELGIVRHSVHQVSADCDGVPLSDSDIDTLEATLRTSRRVTLSRGEVMTLWQALQQVVPSDTNQEIHLSDAKDRVRSCMKRQPE